MYAYSGEGDQSSRPSGSQSNGDACRDQAICAWRPDTSDSAQAVNWRQANEATRSQPLQLNKDGTYTVTKADCLESIAERELRMTGRKINSQTIDDEVKNLVKLNEQDHPTLDCNSQFLGTGWKLKLSITDQQSPVRQTQGQGDVVAQGTQPPPGYRGDDWGDQSGYNPGGPYQPYPPGNPALRLPFGLDRLLRPLTDDDSMYQPGWTPGYQPDYFGDPYSQNFGGYGQNYNSWNRYHHHQRPSAYQQQLQPTMQNTGTRYPQSVVQTSSNPVYNNGSHRRTETVQQPVPAHTPPGQVVNQTWNHPTRPASNPNWSQPARPASNPNWSQLPHPGHNPQVVQNPHQIHEAQTQQVVRKTT